MTAREWRVGVRRCDDCGDVPHEFRPDWRPGPAITYRHSGWTWRCTGCGMSGRSHDPRTATTKEARP